MDPVVHFEMPAKDKARMVAFYEKTFGWKGKEMGNDFGGYVVMQTTETDDKGMIKEPGRINGGFYETKTVTSPHVVIAVKDLKASMKMVEEGGGKILNGPTDIPHVGTFASFTDTEGNPCAMLQPAPNM